MGFLDELKDKAEQFGDKAQEGFGVAKDKTEEVIENVKDRFDGDDTATPADEEVGYSSEGAEGIKEAALEATETAGSAVDEAVGSHQEVAPDRPPGSESW